MLSDFTLVAKGAVARRAAYELVSAQMIEGDKAGATAIRQPPADFHSARKTGYTWHQAQSALLWR